METDRNAANGLSQESGASTEAETVQAQGAGQTDAAGDNGGVISGSNVAEPGAVLVGAVGVAQGAEAGAGAIGGGSAESGIEPAPAVASGGADDGLASGAQAATVIAGEASEKQLAAEELEQGQANETTSAILARGDPTEPRADVGRSLSQDERDEIDARIHGVTVEEIRGARDILKVTQPIPATVEDLASIPLVRDPEGAEAGNVAGDTSVPAFGRYDGIRPGEYHVGPIGGTDLEVLMAQRLTGHGWATVPIVIQHLDNGTSRELEPGELEEIRGGGA